MSTIAIIAVGCGGNTMGEVSPQEIPDLEQRLSASPNNSDLLLRYGAALFATGRCDSAIAVARRGWAGKPSDALGPLVIGQCHEQAERFSQAIDVYNTFLAEYPSGRGSGSVQARQTIASRGRATQVARTALAQEQQGSQQTPSPQSIAVLPVFIAGDSSYQALSRGLAALLTSDLALIERFQLLERLEMSAILDELDLGQTDRVDQQTAARVGRLMQAGRLVQGVATIPDNGSMRIEANVVSSQSQVEGTGAVSGRFRDLLSLEKELVVLLAGRLGYQLSEAERQTILRNGTRNLTAFLAYSSGLDAEDRGDFTAAAGLYAQAVRADPNFSQARSRHKSAVATPAAQQSQPSQVATLSAEPTREADGFGADAAVDALGGALGDLASTNAEQRTKSVSRAPVETVAAQPVSTTAGNPNPPSVIPGPDTFQANAVIRIVFILP